MSEKKITVPDIIQKKERGEKITMLTAYDYPMASILGKLDIDMLLVGDSAAMVVAGDPNSLSATMEQMLLYLNLTLAEINTTVPVHQMAQLLCQKQDKILATIDLVIQLIVLVLGKMGIINQD